MATLHTANLSGIDTIEHYIHEYAHQEQVRMMTAWLEKHRPGAFSFTGLVDPDDATVITPQATVDYGYCWFSLSEGPAIVRTPSYRYFFSVSVFDMQHNVPAVVAHPTKPILLVRPGQAIPDGDFEVVELETDQGLAFTRMVVVDNLAEVEALRPSIAMGGGDGDMHRPVARFSPAVEKSAKAIIAAAIPHISPDTAFSRRSTDTGDVTRAAAVMLGQLGTPSDTVRYQPILADDDGAPLNGTDAYEVRVPAGVVPRASRPTGSRRFPTGTGSPTSASTVLPRRTSTGAGPSVTSSASADCVAGATMGLPDGGQRGGLSGGRGTARRTLTGPRSCTCSRIQAGTGAPGRIRGPDTQAASWTGIKRWAEAEFPYPARGMIRSGREDKRRHDPTVREDRAVRPNRHGWLRDGQRSGQGDGRPTIGSCVGAIRSVEKMNGFGFAGHTVPTGGSVPSRRYAST